MKGGETTGCGPVKFWRACSSPALRQQVLDCGHLFFLSTLRVWLCTGDWRDLCVIPTDPSENACVNGPLSETAFRTPQQLFVYCCGWRGCGVNYTLEHRLAAGLSASERPLPVPLVTTLKQRRLCICCTANLTGCIYASTKIMVGKRIHKWNKWPYGFSLNLSNYWRSFCF